jgi:hypothetical protein
MISGSDPGTRAQVKTLSTSIVHKGLEAHGHICARLGA